MQEGGRIEILMAAVADTQALDVAGVLIAESRAYPPNNVVTEAKCDESSRTEDNGRLQNGAPTSL
jgi:hypothetical protein